MKFRFLLVGAACSLISTVAAAAPQPSCIPKTMTPRAGTIPANLPGFAYSATNATLSDVHLFTVGASRAEVPLMLGKTEDKLLQILPATPLVPGTNYELQYDDKCSFPITAHEPLSFLAAAEAPLPTTIGTVKGPSKGAAAPNYEFTLQGEYLLSAEIKPWRGVYTFEVSIDDETTILTTTAGGDDVVPFAVEGICSATIASKTTHVVKVSAKLAFAPPVPPITSMVDFTCTAAPPPSYGGSSGSSSSGCSTGRVASSRAVGLLAIAIGLAAARGLRRRRAP